MILSRHRFNRPRNATGRFLRPKIKHNLSWYLAAIGVKVEPGTAPTRVHIELAHRIIRGAGGNNVELNGHWNEIKRYICPACGAGLKRPKSGTCSIVCGMNLRQTMTRSLATCFVILLMVGCKKDQPSTPVIVPSATNAVYKPKPVSPPSPQLVSEKIAATRAARALFATLPNITHTNGVHAVSFTFPWDDIVSARGIIFRVGTTNGIFKDWMTCGQFGNATLKGLDETRTNYVYCVTTNAAGVESPPSNVLAVQPRTNLTVSIPLIASYSMRLMWPTNIGILAIERTLQLPPTWSRFALVTNSGSFVATNLGSMAFYRANASTTPRPVLGIQEWQKRISFDGAGVLQVLADKNSGSWTNVLTNTSGNVTTVQPAGRQYQVMR